MPENNQDLGPILERIYGELRQINSATQTQSLLGPLGVGPSPQVGQLPMNLDGGYLMRPYHDAGELQMYLSGQMRGFSSSDVLTPGMELASTGFGGPAPLQESGSHRTLERINESVQEVVGAVKESAKAISGPIAAVGHAIGAAPGVPREAVRSVMADVGWMAKAAGIGGGALGRDVTGLMVVRGGQPFDTIRAFGQQLKQYEAGQRQTRYVSPLERVPTEVYALQAINAGIGLTKLGTSTLVGTVIGVGTSFVGSPAVGLALGIGGGIVADKVLDVTFGAATREFNDRYMRMVSSLRTGQDVLRTATGQRNVPLREAERLMAGIAPGRMHGGAFGLLSRQVSDWQYFLQFGTNTEEVVGGMRRLADEGRLDVSGDPRNFNKMARRIRSRVLRVMKDVDEASRLLDVTKEEAWKIVEQNERAGITGRQRIESAITAAIATGQSTQAVLAQQQQAMQVLGGFGIGPGQLGITMPTGAAIAAARVAPMLTPEEMRRVGGRAGVTEAITAFTLNRTAQNADVMRFALGAGTNLSQVKGPFGLQEAAVRGMAEGGVAGYYRNLYRGSMAQRNLKGEELVQFQARHTGEFAELLFPNLMKQKKEDALDTLAGFMKSQGLTDEQARVAALQVYNTKKMGAPGGETFAAQAKADIAIGQAVARGERAGAFARQVAVSTITGGLGTPEGRQVWGTAAKSQMAAQMVGQIPIVGGVMSTLVANAPMLAKGTVYAGEELRKSAERKMVEAELAEKGLLVKDEQQKFVDRQREFRANKDARAVVRASEELKDSTKFKEAMRSEEYKKVSRDLQQNKALDEKLKGFADKGDVKGFVDALKKDVFGGKMAPEQYKYAALLAEKYKVDLKSVDMTTGGEIAMKYKDAEEKARKKQEDAKTPLFSAEERKKMAGTKEEERLMRLYGKDIDQITISDKERMDSSKQIEWLSKIKGAIGGKTPTSAATDLKTLRGSQLMYQTETQLSAALDSGKEPLNIMIELMRMSNQLLANIAAHS